MRSRRASIVGLLAIAGCSDPQVSAHDDPAAAATPLVIAPNRTEVVVYENPAGDDGLPYVVPVIVSYGAQAPSVAVRIACASNYGRMLEGFGYSPDLNLDTVDRYSSLDSLRSVLRERSPNAQDVPLRTLRCERDEAAIRDQLVAIYRVVDADATKGQAGYYAKLKDDPEAIYSLGCWNIVKALGWDNGTAPPPKGALTASAAPSCDWGCGWEDSTTIPVNQANLATWAEAGVVQRELNCYDMTGRAMPPVKTSLATRPRPAPEHGTATLVRVRYAFDGISAPMPLYLISNGKGYALDCGSNQREIKQAFGFGPDDVVPELATSDPLFLGSGPGAQPNLRCNDVGTKAFQTVDESPPSTYFQFAGAKRLFQFTSDLTRDAFLAQAAETRRVPWASVPHLLPDADAPNAPTEVLRVGYATSDECASRSANCGNGKRCLDESVGFRCEACATGYAGDGYTCRDIDECATHTASCAATTYCVNEPGRHRCDSCAVGQTSDGYTCRAGAPFTWFDTLEADRTRLGFSTYGGKQGYDWLKAAGPVTSTRMATLFCRSKGFPAGRVNGWAAGEKIGVRCLPTDAVRFDLTKAQRDAVDATVGDITTAPWWKLHAFAQQFCPTKGYEVGFLTGETSGTNATLYCLPKKRNQWFDSTRAERTATGFAFDSTYNVDWHTATLMATKYCESRGYSGGFCTGYTREDTKLKESYAGVNCYK